MGAFNSAVVGQHYIIEFYQCGALLNNLQEIATIMYDAAVVSGATILSQHFHPFEPQGVSGVIVIAESHLSIHTWPEHDYAAIDVFTCSDKMSPDKALEHLQTMFRPQKIDVRKLRRG
jgi:S-adenosylmethionine decarboxylase proenzyme